MNENVFVDDSSIELNVSITRLRMLDGKVMFRLYVVKPNFQPIDLLFQTYNGAVIGLSRLLFNNMAAE